jgi:allantoicase
MTQTSTVSGGHGVRVSFTDLIDLAAARIGGRVLHATDDFFAQKENLLETPPPIFIPDKYTENGKWMDGWESRRRREPGHDWCIVRLGLPGVIHGVNVDTSYFAGNHPESCSIEACSVDGDPPFDGPGGEGAELWTEILPRVRLRGDSHNYFAVTEEKRYTHLRLNIYPDGGVARLRVHGKVRADLSRMKMSEGLVDLAAAENGGDAVACNDEFFSPMHNLILPGRAANMGEGWETRRRRVPGHDWVVLRLATPGHIQRVEVDTNHFKGNYPESFSLEGAAFEGRIHDFIDSHIPWKTLLPRTKLGPHERHYFDSEIVEGGPFSHVRLNIFPDGGISRLRLWGTAE